MLIIYLIKAGCLPQNYCLIYLARHCKLAINKCNMKGQNNKNKFLLSNLAENIELQTETNKLMTLLVANKLLIIKTNSLQKMKRSV